MMLVFRGRMQAPVNIFRLKIRSFCCPWLLGQMGWFG